MVREQLIECIANAVEQGPGRTLPPYRKMAEHVLDAITAAGMVVVPREQLLAFVHTYLTKTGEGEALRQSADALLAVNTAP